jgi:1,4-dihydroxy-2-naphthoate octaprenyltransferase
MPFLLACAGHTCRPHVLTAAVVCFLAGSIATAWLLKRMFS